MMGTFAKTSGPSWTWLGLMGFFAGILLMIGGVLVLLLNLGPAQSAELTTSILLLQSGGVVLVVSVVVMAGETFLRH